MTSFIKRLFRGGKDKAETPVTPPAEAAAPAPDAAAATTDYDWPPEGELDYDVAKALARHADRNIRHALATRGDVQPELLYYLSEDTDLGVRRALVANMATPALAHLVLADDKDDAVRADLAERISRLAPGLTHDERDRARQTAYRVLERLVQDQIPHVRQVLSEALKDVVDAPAPIIKTLARDAVEAVSSPVLQYSPVLRDEDLLDIIAERPTTAALTAISRRNRVGPDVADAIAQTDDVDAISVLLTNESAQIREETLDDLIERAEERPQWHEPMARRPRLHERAARRLAHFVADRLIEVLIARNDLSEETLVEVKRVVHRRLEEGTIDGSIEAVLKRYGGDATPAAENEAETDRKVPPPNDEIPAHWLASQGKVEVISPSAIEALKRARDMAKAGTLTEAAVVRALKRSELEFVVAALAVLAGLEPGVVLAAVRAASPRGVAAVVWKAGLGPIVSVQVQTRLARIAPREVISGHDDLGFGLSESEMEWQIEMFTKVAEEGVF